MVVGAPLRREGELYNAAVIIHRGAILGVVPKTYLPNYREFYERRHFASGAAVRNGHMRIGTMEAPFGVDMLFRSTGAIDLTFHVEICEDVWVPLPPSTGAALAGAEILINLSASNITIGKAETRRLLCASQSARAIAVYIYSAAGPGESTTDLAWDGHAAIFEQGDLLAETERFAADSTVITADVDLGRIRQERMRSNTFGDCRREEAERAARFRSIGFKLDRPQHAIALKRAIERFPYVPADPDKLAENCYEAYNIQVQGLTKRLQATGTKRVVLGVSGGLDSTQAALVAARAMDRLGLSRTNVLAYTLPGFATSAQTKENAGALIRALGLTYGEIDIRPVARQMLADIGHPFARGEPVYDVTFENVQAGVRTDYLFRIANQRGGLVLGTGDLSELGLGWCTYGVGDHMSHYNVNASVAKTLIQHLIRFVAASGQVETETARVLHAIVEPRSLRNWCQPDRAVSSNPLSRRLDPMRSRISICSTSLDTAFGHRKLRFWRATPGKTQHAVDGHQIYRPANAALIPLQRSVTGLRFFWYAFLPSVSLSGRRCRTARRFPLVARCRREATGGLRRTVKLMFGLLSSRRTCR